MATQSATPPETKRPSTAQRSGDVARGRALGTSSAPGPGRTGLRARGAPPRRRRRGPFLPAISWYVSCPLPASTTTSPGRALSSARLTATWRSGSTTRSALPPPPPCADRPTPAITSAMIAAGSSSLGLSDVRKATSEPWWAARPINGRLARSRLPPQPKTQSTRPPSEASVRASARTTSRPAGVWA